MSAASDALARYGAVALGLAIGTAAKYGVALTDGENPTWRGLIADGLMLSMLGLIAVVTVDVLNLANPNAKVFVGAVAALLSARLIKMVRDRAEKRAGTELDTLLGVARAADAVQIPPFSGKPDALRAQVMPADRTASAGASLRTIYGDTATAPLPPDQQGELDKLKDD